MCWNQEVGSGGGAHRNLQCIWSEVEPVHQDGLQSNPGDFNVHPGWKITDSGRKRQRRSAETVQGTQMENTPFKSRCSPYPRPRQANLRGDRVAVGTER